MSPGGTLATLKTKDKHTKCVLTVSRKPDNIANKSNDNYNVELDEQSQEELLNSELLPEQNHTIS